MLGELLLLEGRSGEDRALGGGVTPSLEEAGVLLLCIVPIEEFRAVLIVGKVSKFDSVGKMSKFD